MPKTYNDIYFLVRNKLHDIGIEAYSQEARFMLAAASNKTVEQLMRDMYLYTSDDVEKVALDMLQRRLDGEPLAYICGMWEFYGLPMYVTPDVLIPRMDTEIMVSAAVSAYKGLNMKGRILDLCCGSGCIACAISSEIPTARLVAADISTKALEVCRRNIKLNKLSPRVITINLDATKWPPTSIGSYDLIVSNPPYICSEEISLLDKSVRDFEPHLALDGGNDGLYFYREIISHWTITLRPNGVIMFEVGEGQADDVKKLLLDFGYVSAQSIKDTLGVERVVVGRWKNEF